MASTGFPSSARHSRGRSRQRNPKMSGKLAPASANTALTKRANSLTPPTMSEEKSNAETPCCPCSRQATCCRLSNSAKRSACPCRQGNRRCTSCASHHRACRNLGRDCCDPSQPPAAKRARNQPSILDSLTRAAERPSSTERAPAGPPTGETAEDGRCEECTTTDGEEPSNGDDPSEEETSTEDDHAFLEAEDRRGVGCEVSELSQEANVGHKRSNAPQNQRHPHNDNNERDEGGEDGL